MPKKRKQSLLWRAVKGIFKGIFWLIKQLFLGIAWIIKSIYHLISGKIKKNKEENKMARNPTYNAQAQYEPLAVMKTFSGDFQDTEQRLNQDSLILLIFGKRGSGKTALGFKLLENIHNNTNRKCYVLGVEQSLLPKWIISITDVDQVHNSSIVLVDEGAVSFSSRDSMSSKNKELSKLMAIARHKDLTLIFITQNTGMIDKNILKLVDTLMIKEGSLLQQEMERKEIQRFYEKADQTFKTLQGNIKSFVYIIDSDFEGVISAPLPTFWHERISKNKAN